MEFVQKYEKYHLLKFNCNIEKNFRVKKMMFGSGGSSNIVIAVIDKNDENLIIKVMLDIIIPNVIIKPDMVQLEIKFYQFFTKKYILTNRTPHIVGIYNHQACKKFSHLIKNLRKKACPTYDEELTKKKQTTDEEDKLCNLKLKNESGLIGNDFEIILVEYCDGGLEDVLQYYVGKIKSSKKKYKEIVIDFISQLVRILFQLIFTLAIIKDDYPGFIHADFFVRNILYSTEIQYGNNDFVAYHYKQRIFYLSANGIYAKMNDFGQSIIVDELQPSVYDVFKIENKYYHINPFDKKTDIFNLLHDIYDGQNLGTQSINQLAQNNGIEYFKMKPVFSMLNKFIDLAAIDKINANNRKLLDRTWYIDNIRVLEKTVKTPDEYLKGGQFKFLQTLPKQYNIVKHFNKPK